MIDNDYDVVVIGGGAAGLNGALMLARARRRVLTIDAGAPRNAPAEGVHGLLGHDGIPPAELLSRGRDEVTRYGGELATGRVDTVTGRAGEFTVRLDDGRDIAARRILITAGVVDELPDVPGLREHWGRDVVHCPYCHGWEVRDHPIAILATGPMSIHQALLFRQWSHDITYFAHTRPVDDDTAEQFAAVGIDVVTGTVAEIESTGGRISGLRLTDGRRVARDTVAVVARPVPRVDFAAGLGLHPVPHPSGMADHLPADSTGRTDVPGVWAAGNVTDPMAQVGASAAAGAMAGAQINADLVAEHDRAALDEYRASRAVHG